MAAATRPHLIDRLARPRGRLTADAPLGPQTWFATGGPAEVLPSLQWVPPTAASVKEMISPTGSQSDNGTPGSGDSNERVNRARRSKSKRSSGDKPDKDMLT